MATHRYNVSIHQDVSTRYASDLTDQEFALLAPHVAQKDGSGKKRTVDIREVLNAIFYRIRTGYQWRMLPSDFPAWYHVWYYYRSWRARQHSANLSSNRNVARFNGRLVG